MEETTHSELETQEVEHIPATSESKSTVWKTLALALLVFAVSVSAVLGFMLYTLQPDFSSLLPNRTTGAQTADQPEVYPLTQSEESVVSIVEMADPAVVSIVVTQDVPVVERYYEEFNPFGFGDNVFRIPRERQNGTREREIGGGSGFFVSADGLLVTNRHVVDTENADYSIVTNDGATHEVEVLARDEVLDVAVLQVVNPDREFAHLAFGDSSSLKLGQSVIAIGNALGEFRNSVSTGVVSGLARSIVAGNYASAPEVLDEVIQTDAAINPGNSGGPLLNSSGQVIGINVATALADNVSFAIPSNTVRQVVDSVEVYGEIRRPFLGVRYVMVTPQLAQSEELDVTYGAFVARGATAMDIAVLPDSPAGKAGIQEGDVIIEIDGTSLKERGLASVIRDKAIGQELKVVVVRDGEEVELSAVLDIAPE